MSGGKLEYEKRGKSRKSTGKWEVPVSKGIKVVRSSYTKRHGPMGQERIKSLAQKLLAKRAKESSGQEGE